MLPALLNCVGVLGLDEALLGVYLSHAANNSFELPGNSLLPSEGVDYCRLPLFRALVVPPGLTLVVLPFL